MKVYIDQMPMRTGHAGRGIGQYTRMVVEALKKYSDLELVDSEAAADVVHYPFFDLFFLTLPFIKNKPTVVTVHDVIPLLYPAAYPKGVRGQIKLFLQTMSLNGASHIITDSDCSTNDVIYHLHQPKNKVTTVYLAPDERFEPATPEMTQAVKDKYGLHTPYLLYVGDINYNKNLDSLFLSLSELKEDIRLVVISKTLRRDNPAATSLMNLIDEFGLQQKIKVLTDIGSDNLDELKGIYSGALWYIQPSFYEGFGLPVLEAQACGTPVIASTGGSLAEIAGTSTLGFDPEQSGRLRDVVQQAILMGDDQRSAYKEKGFMNAKRFSWEKTVKEMVEVYEKLA